MQSAFCNSIIPVQDPKQMENHEILSDIHCFSLNYLPNDILTKVDRASMSTSLETRAPFLDHILAEFVWSTPVEWRINKDGGKRILKDVLYKFV